MSEKQKLAFNQYLRTHIMTMKLTPGADLDETELSQEFRLSRTPIREIFRQLAGEGYLELRAGKGAKVSELSYTTLHDFFLVAPMIYGAVLRLAAQNAKPDQIQQLQAAQAEFRKVAPQGNNAARALANHRFHEITGEMSANIYLLPSFRRLLIDHARIAMSFYKDSTQDTNVDISADQHDQMIAAITNQDAQRAQALANEHWELSRGEIEKFVTPKALTLPLGAIHSNRGQEI